MSAHTVDPPRSLTEGPRRRLCRNGSNTDPDSTRGFDLSNATPRHHVGAPNFVIRPGLSTDTVICPKGPVGFKLGRAPVVTSRQANVTDKSVQPVQQVTNLNNPTLDVAGLARRR